MTIKVHTVTITPAKAKAMLDESIALGVTNRRVAQAHIDMYASEMKANRWKLNGVAIKLDEQGGVLDGQHRLLACIKADTPFQTILMSGVPRETFDTLDCGRSRTASQVLQMSGVKYNALIAGIIRGVAEIKNSGQLTQHSKRFSNAAILDEYNARSADYDASAKFGACAVSETHAMSQKMAASLHYYLIHELGQSADLVEKFISDITSFDSSSIAVADKLRKWNLQNVNSRIPDRIRLGYIILTWNAMLRKAKAPRFCEKALEPMPTFLTK